MGVSLAAVPNDANRLIIEQINIGVFVVVDLNHCSLSSL